MYEITYGTKMADFSLRSTIELKRDKRIHPQIVLI